MPQQIRTSQDKTIEYSSNNRVSKSLATGSIYREIYLHLEGAPTLSGVNNTAAKTKLGDEWAVIKKIEVVLNSTQTIRSFTGNDLFWLNHFWYGGSPRKTTTLGDGTTANPSFSSCLILPFWMPGTRRPFDTALDTGNISDLSIEITWGSYTDINNDATAWTTEPKVNIYSNLSFSNTEKFSFSQWNQFVIEREVTANSPRYQIDLPIGHVYKSFLINTTDAGVDVGTIVNNVKLVSGSLTYFDSSEVVLSQVPYLRRGFQRSFNGQTYDDLRIGDDNDMAGWYYVDLIGDGMLSESIDTVGFSEMKLEFDVSVGGGTTKVRVIPDQIKLIRQAA